VISNNYSAEYGHSTGGIIALSTRSGTNQFHGSLFEFARNNALDARNFFSAGTPPLKLHQFGGSLGGRSSKTRRISSRVGKRRVRPSARRLWSTVPTLAQRRGDFSQVKKLDLRSLTLAGGKKEPYPGNLIPRGSLDPVAVSALAYIPLPNRGVTNFGANAIRRCGATSLSANWTTI